MMSLEEDVAETLRMSGPCCLEDIAMNLPNFSWGAVFLAVDRMYRNGRVSLLQLGCSTYLITLCPQFPHLASTPNEKGMESSLVG